MKPSHAVETLLLRGIAGGLGAMSWPAARDAGAALGSTLGALGVRRRVARANLRIAFPERDAAWREHVLAQHYKELGRVAAEYTQMARMVRAPRDQVVARWEGERHALEAAAFGRGVIFLTGHLCNFEFNAALLAQTFPMALLVKPLSNPGAEAWLSDVRRACGFELLPIGAGVRGAVRRLRAGGALAMLADQDARRDGVFVPFFGRPASTPTGPAWLSLATGAPIVFGICSRAADGRHELRILPPLLPDGDAHDPDAVRELTARHTALLEAAVRERPHDWFWLHKRWKTSFEPALPPAPIPRGSRAQVPGAGPNEGA